VENDLEAMSCKPQKSICSCDVQKPDRMDRIVPKGSKAFSMKHMPPTKFVKSDNDEQTE